MACSSRQLTAVARVLVGGDKGVGTSSALHGGHGLCHHSTCPPWCRFVLLLGHAKLFASALLSAGFRRLMPFSHCKEKAQQSLEVLYDFASPKLGLSIEAIHKHDGHFLDGHAHCSGMDNDFHLECVSFGNDFFDECLEAFFPVEAERPRQVRDSWIQHRVGQEVGDSAGKLSKESPSIHTSSIGISCS